MIFFYLSVLRQNSEETVENRTDCLNPSAKGTFVTFPYERLGYWNTNGISTRLPSL